jgi:hypothetical protein
LEPCGNTSNFCKKLRSETKNSRIERK